MSDEQTAEPASLTVVHVRTEPTDLSRTAAGSIVGPVWLSAGPVSFPEPKWSDFPVALVGAWLQAALSIHTGRQQHALCSFMDGPYSFALDARSKMIWHVSFLGPADDVRAEFDVHAYGFSGSLAAAAGQLMSACRERGWSGRDLEVLKALHRQRQRA
jgi:hypothetical protein